MHLLCIIHSVSVTAAAAAAAAAAALALRCYWHPCKDISAVQLLSAEYMQPIRFTLIHRCKHTYIQKYTHRNARI